NLRSDSAWLLTNDPYHGRAVSGHMFVTNKTFTPDLA
ncbi:MAG: hypothetical protein QOH12_101, partial [Solirubrobacteraceae bacterium]|nr:hypothetical protein [Solirubrobacteraceae bacterium]